MGISREYLDNRVQLLWESRGNHRGIAGEYPGEIARYYTTIIARYYSTINGEFTEDFHNPFLIMLPISE